MNSNKLVTSATLGLALIVTCVGCGVSDVERAEVVGQVTLDGLPVEDALVVFDPSSSNGSTVWCVIQEGEFKFSDEDGPPPGSYEVVIKPREPDSEVVFEEIRKRQSASLATRYLFQSAVNRKGPIHVDVSNDGVNEVKIELTSK